MNFAKLESYEMDRRKWLKLTGTTMGAAIGGTMLLPEEAFAAGECEKLYIENGKVNAEQAGNQLQFWIDGIHFGARSEGLKSRANLAIYIDQQQTSSSYVESVVLMSPAKQTMAARYFDASTKMRSGRVPYVIFDNVELQSGAAYTVVFTKRNGSNVKIYSAKIDKPQVSTLNAQFLPEQMRLDFTTFLVGGENKTPGLVTTPYQFYTTNGLALHSARARVKDMAADGSNFTVNIDFMHPDVNAQHFMRYFVVMDPVGRILGFKKRNGMGDGGVTQGTLDVTKETTGFLEAQVANIADCPYVQCFTEDSYDAIARTVLRLR